MSKSELSRKQMPKISQNNKTPKCKLHSQWSTRAMGNIDTNRIMAISLPCVFFLLTFLISIPSTWDKFKIRISNKINNNKPIIPISAHINRNILCVG